MPPRPNAPDCTAITRIGYFCDCANGAVGRPIAPMKLVQAAKEPDERQDRNRHPNKPQQEIASHRQSSTFLVWELVAWHEVPNTFLQRSPWLFFKDVRGLRNKKFVNALSFAMGRAQSDVRFESVFGKESK